LELFLDRPKYTGFCGTLLSNRRAVAKVQNPQETIAIRIGLSACNCGLFLISSETQPGNPSWFRAAVTFTPQLLDSRWREKGGPHGAVLRKK
jgi:hypothetical protein